MVSVNVVINRKPRTSLFWVFVCTIFQFFFSYNVITINYLRLNDRKHFHNNV